MYWWQGDRNNFHWLSMIYMYLGYSGNVNLWLRKGNRPNFGLITYFRLRLCSLLHGIHASSKIVSWSWKLSAVGCCCWVCTGRETARIKTMFFAPRNPFIPQHCLLLPGMPSCCRWVCTGGKTANNDLHGIPVRIRVENTGQFSWNPCGNLWRYRVLWLWWAGYSNVTKHELR